MTSINYPSYAENTNTDNFQVVGYNETTQAVERKNLGSAIDAKIVASSGAVQSAYQLIPQLIFKWFDDNNNPADGWLITSYEAGTTTPVDTYSDDVGTLNDNPITLNDRGEARIFLDSTLVYKFVITDALGGNVQTFDNITGVGGVSSGGGGSVAGNVGDLQLNKDGVNFGASGLNWSGGVLTINNSGTGSFTQDYSDLSKVTTTTAYGTGSVTQVVQSGAVSTTLTGSAGSLALVSDATRQSITMDNVSITSDAQSSFGLGVVLGGGLALIDGSVDYTGGVFRFRENGVTRGFNATSITYDNAVSGLTATDVKSAIDELNTNANTLTMETITTSELNTALVAKPDGVGGVTWGTDSATPAGANTEIQVNVGGVFGAYSSLTYDGSKLLVPQIGSSTFADYTNAVYAKKGRFDSADPSNTPTDYMLYARNNNATSTQDAVSFGTAGLGKVLSVYSSNSANDDYTVNIVQDGLGGALVVDTDNGQSTTTNDHAITVIGRDQANQAVSAVKINGGGDASDFANALWANTTNGRYSIRASGGSYSSIYADNGITLGNNTTGTINGTLRYTGSDAEVLKGGVWTSLTEVSAPAGSNTEIQFNNAGAFGASSSLTWDGTKLDITGNLDVTGTGSFGDDVTITSSDLIIDQPTASGEFGTRFFRVGTERGRFSFDYSQSRAVIQGDGDIRFYTNGELERMKIGNNGDVTVNENLNVTGSIITGSFASAPSSPTAGQIYFNTTTNKHQGYDGTTWNNLY